ncbi:hypothetical protein V2I01_05780 [Micromonospora sp. BRA006-A]|nr:hypothetical protein [Micromonospora sp. BRA006-A]
MAMVSVIAWQWWQNHPPYGPEALALRSSLSFVTNEEAQAALGENGSAPLASDVTSWCSAGSPGRPRPGLSTAATSRSSSSTSAPTPSQRSSAWPLQGGRRHRQRGHRAPDRRALLLAPWRW